jgi:hypothetical protein
MVVARSCGEGLAMKRRVLVFWVGVIVVSIFAVGFLGLQSASSANQGLTTDLTKLQKDYDALQDQYFDLMWNYSLLERNFEGVLLERPSFAPNPAGSSSSDTQQYLVRYQALQDSYAQLRSEYNHYVNSYYELRKLTDARLMRETIKEFITPSDPSVVNITHSITGKIGNITDPNSYWKDIKAMYDWVNKNIEYREDGLYPILPSDPTNITFEGLKQTDQMLQLPNETLSLRKGDCEDFAVLLTSMIRSYFDKQFTVECIWITGASSGHVAVVIPFDGRKIVILDPIRDYFSHDTIGDIALNNIYTEIYNWMNIWRPSLGNDIHVHRVFSDYVDEYFESTEEYINWMYVR